MEGSENEASLGRRGWEAHARDAAAIDRLTPDARSTPYSKRWFSPNLKVQRVEVNQLRRRWQESCAELGRDDARSTALFQEMQRKRRAWTRTIEKAKSSHWKQFLDEAGEGICGKPRPT